MMLRLVVLYYSRISCLMCAPYFPSAVENDDPVSEFWAVPVLFHLFL